MLCPDAVRMNQLYGLNIGQVQPDTAGKRHHNTVGIYIVDYASFHKDAIGIGMGEDGIGIEPTKNKIF